MIMTDRFSFLHTSKALPSASFHLYSIWLFTRSDLKTIVIPSTIFTIANSLAISDTSTTASGNTRFAYGTGTILAFCWTWLNLLPFNIANQRQQSSVLEDAINKPWRPMPSRRLTYSQATSLMLIAYGAAIALSSITGGFTQCLCLIGLGVWYNDLHGADRHFLIRNLINGCGFICFASGAFENCVQQPSAKELLRAPWLVLIAAVVFSTIQTQDLYDQDGDRLRNRRTMPLVVGDSVTRKLTAVLMAFWSLVVPWLWSLSILCSVPFVSLGAVVAARTLLYRTVSADKRTFWVWNAWMVALYFSPFLHQISCK